MKIKNVFVMAESPQGCAELQGLVKTIPLLMVAGATSDSFSATENFDYLSEVELLIIDMARPLPEDFKKMRSLLQRFEPLQIILISEDSEAAILAFDAGLIDFLLRPLRFARFEKAMQRFLNLRRPRLLPSLMITLKTPEGNFVQRVRDIVFLQSSQRKTLVHATNRVIQTGRSLKRFEELLPEGQFYRVHKCYIVNIDYISRIKHIIGGQYDIFLNDPEESTVPIGVKYVPALKERIALV